ncbi:glycosyltransferase family 4 protein [Planktomarina temperata]|nr:glycosyltransferase family 4 protein [Planktomarina temperata]
MSSKVILHVHQRFLPYNSGSTVRLLRLIEIDQRNSDRQHIVLCWDGGDQSLPRSEAIEGIQVYRFTSYYEILFLLPRIILKHRPAIIHSHNFRPGFYATPYLIFFQKSILEMHAYYEPRGLLQQKITKYLFNLYKIKLFNSKGVQNRFAVSAKGDQDHFVIYNPLPNKLAADVTELGNQAINLTKTPTFGYLGSLEVFQGIDNVIEFAKIHTDCDVLVFGRGSLQEVVKQAAKQINNLYYCGEYKYTDVGKIYSKIDVSLILRPSMPETETTVPLKIIESIVFNTPILATKVGGLLELSDVFKTDWLNFSDELKVGDYDNMKLIDSNEREILISKLGESNTAERLRKIYC